MNWMNFGQNDWNGDFSGTEDRSITESQQEKKTGDSENQTGLKRPEDSGNHTGLKRPEDSGNRTGLKKQKDEKNRYVFVSREQGKLIADI